jgi:hypothetical protein
VLFIIGYIPLLPTITLDADLTDTNLTTPAAKPAQKPAKTRRAGAREMPLLSLVVAGVLLYGWVNRAEGHIVAEDGIGYYLGITGSVMMLLLLLYPLRKRLRGLRVIGNVRGWFRLHMLLGVIGPALVLLHSNFSLGSLNSTIALFAMLTVAGSGYIGRFLYAHIHRGLYGKKLNTQEMKAEIAALHDELALDERAREAVNIRLGAFEKRMIGKSLFSSLSQIISGPFARRTLKRQVLTEVRSALKQLPAKERRKAVAAVLQTVNQYLASTARAEAFTFYERMFALWHLLHLPLFFILVLAALAHILAVHLY